MEMARFAEPIDKIVMADWQGDEIGEVMEEIKEVIEIIEDAQADIY